jgi:hypothetical protein|tara:strand:+ start:59 stop:253 length:195 start_codon:yes stop_codon:yes gene_type:complete
MFYTKEKIDKIMQVNQVTSLEDQLKTMELIKGLQDLLKIQQDINSDQKTINDCLKERIEKLEEK